MSVSACKVFTGKNVVLTGVTGYVGQLLLAKMLAVCPDLAQVFILIRDKESATGQQRFRQLVRSSLAFGMVRNSCRAMGISDYITWVDSKCTVVSGDISKPNWALDTPTMATVIETADVMIHSAADVSFTNGFESAVRSNLIGTVHSLNLAKQCSKKPLFCYVSTAYVSSHQRDDTYEHEPEPVSIPFRASELVDAYNNGDSKYIERMYQKMVDMKWPNTYVMSKACAENYVLDEHADLPLEIIRPSMIASAWKDISQPGWNKSPQSGPTLCTYAIGLGALTIAPVHPEVENHLDLVPSDYVCNVIIAALACRLYDIAADIKYSSQIHYAVMGEHRVPATVFFPEVVAYFRKHPMPARMRRPRVALYPGRKFENHVKLRYSTPIKAIKALAPVLVGPLAKPSKMLVGALEMISKLFRVSRWVVEAEFAFNDEAIQDVFDRLVPEERTALWNDLDELNQVEFIHDFCAGVVRLMSDEARKNKMQIRSNL